MCQHPNPSRSSSASWAEQLAEQLQDGHGQNREVSCPGHQGVGTLNPPAASGGNFKDALDTFPYTAAQRHSWDTVKLQVVTKDGYLRIVLGHSIDTEPAPISMAEVISFSPRGIGDIPTYPSSQVVLRGYSADLCLPYRRFVTTISGGDTAEMVCVVMGRPLRDVRSCLAYELEQLLKIRDAAFNEGTRARLPTIKGESPQASGLFLCLHGMGY